MLILVLGIKKKKEKVDLNVGEIVLHQMDLEVVINQYQRKDVRLVFYFYYHIK